MILIGLGSNLAYRGHAPVEILRDAARRLLSFASVARRSEIFQSRAWPRGDDPAFCNAVIQIETSLDPQHLMARLHGLEAAFGRQRAEANAPRTLDLDVLDFDGQVTGAEETPQLPHPRLTGRLFVLAPLRQIAPDWRHPVTSEKLDDLIAKAPPDPFLAPISADWAPTSAPAPEKGLATGRKQH